MSHTVASGWYGDPGHKHGARFWDGNRWTSSVADHGRLSEDEVPTGHFGPPGSGNRLARWALGVLVVGGAAALAGTVVWGVWMKTSSTLDDEDRVRGWTALWRDLPMAVVAWLVPIVAMALAVRACRHGAGPLGRTTIWLSGVVLFVVSISIIGGEVDNAKTSGEPELKWLLFPVSVVIAVGATFLALRAVRHPRR